jgi:hypothetical protein
MTAGEGRSIEGLRLTEHCWTWQEFLTIRVPLISRRSRYLHLVCNL